ncbi:MAG: choice-of-anchor Q domain-containing protein, partial [Pseudomonadota bacterium]
GDTLLLSGVSDTVHTLDADTPAGKGFNVLSASRDERSAIDTAGGSLLLDLSAGGLVQLRGVDVRGGTEGTAVSVAGSATADALFVVDDVHFYGNVSVAPSRTQPPALALATVPNGHEVRYTITGSRFTNNRHVGAGAGALAFVDGTDLTVHNSVFDGNVAEQDTGGAIWINPTRRADGCRVTVTGSEFYSNVAETGGAMLASRDCNLTVRGTRVGARERGNLIAAGEGFVRGVLFMLTDDTPVTLHVQNSEFAYNTLNPALVSGDGAAVRVTNGAVGKGFVTALFEDSEFHHNEGWSGPAIHAGGETVSVVRRCRFAHNVARGWAGAYFASGTRDSPPFGSHTIEHSLFVDNRSDRAGGAVRVAPYTSLHVVASTFVNNAAADTGNHIDARTSAIATLSTVTNSLFWSDEDNGLFDISAEGSASFGSITNSAHRAGAIGDFGAQVTNSVLLERSPVMADFQLRPTSACIDAGAALPAITPPVDAVGRAVPVGRRPDIGAFEFWRHPAPGTGRE